MKTVKRGSKGAEVKTLQEALNKTEGLYGLAADGIFGAKTETAVRDYQRRQGLSVDGICGPKTWSKLGYDTADEVTAGGRSIEKLIVHCTATKEGQEVSSDTISGWHKARNFPYYLNGKGEKKYTGYHYLIHLDGTVEACRPENVRGCHVTGQNQYSIGICYVGGLDAAGNAKDTRTPAQKEALERLLEELKRKYRKATIHGHREFAAKACPCFDAKEEYRNIAA